MRWLARWIRINILRDPRALRRYHIEMAHWYAGQAEWHRDQADALERGQ